MIGEKILVSDPHLDLQIQKLKYQETPISFFKFLEITSIKKGNILEAQSYNKNYFDLITKNIELMKGYSNDKNKVNYTKDD